MAEYLGKSKGINIIAFDDESVIYTKITRQRHELIVEEQVQLTANDGEQRSDLLHKLNAETLNWGNFPVVLTGILPGTTYIEFKVPKLPDSELNDLIPFEIAKKIPISPENIKLFWRRLPSADEPMDTVRACNTLNSELNKLLDELLIAGIKIDCYTPPYMSVDPLFENCSVSFADSKFVMGTKSSDGIRSFTFSEKPDSSLMQESLSKALAFNQKLFDKDILLMSGAVGVYHLGNLGDSVTYSSLRMPKKMRPQHMVFLRSATILVAAAALLALISIPIRININNIKRYEILKSELNNVEEKSKQALKKLKKVTKRDEKITVLLESIENKPDPLILMETLRKIIPEEDKITSFLLTNDILRVTVFSIDPAKVKHSIKNNPLWTTNYRDGARQRGDYTSTTFTLTIKGGK